MQVNILVDRQRLDRHVGQTVSGQRDKHSAQRLSLWQAERLDWQDATCLPRRRSAWLYRRRYAYLAAIPPPFAPGDRFSYAQDGSPGCQHT